MGKTLMEYQAINFEHKLSLFEDQWQQKAIAEMNDYLLKTTSGFEIY